MEYSSTENRSFLENMIKNVRNEEDNLIELFNTYRKKFYKLGILAHNFQDRKTTLTENFKMKASLVEKFKEFKSELEGFKDNINKWVFNILLENVKSLIDLTNLEIKHLERH